MNTLRKIIALLVLVVLAYGAYRLSQTPATIPDPPVVVPPAPPAEPSMTPAPAVEASSPPATDTGVVLPSSSDSLQKENGAEQGAPKVDPQKKKELLKKQSVFK